MYTIRLSVDGDHNSLDIVGRVRSLQPGSLVGKGDSAGKASHVVRIWSRSLESPSSLATCSQHAVVGSLVNVTSESKPDTAVVLGDDPLVSGRSVLICKDTDVSAGASSKGAVFSCSESVEVEVESAAALRITRAEVNSLQHGECVGEVS